MIIKQSVHWEGKTILKVHAWTKPPQNASKCMKQKLRELKGETDKHTVIAGDLNTPLLAIGRTIRQKIKKDIE